MWLPYRGFIWHRCNLCWPLSTLQANAINALSAETMVRQKWLRGSGQPCVIPLPSTCLTHWPPDMRQTCCTHVTSYWNVRAIFNDNEQYHKSVLSHGLVFVWLVVDWVPNRRHCATWKNDGHDAWLIYVPTGMLSCYTVAHICTRSSRMTCYFTQHSNNNCRTLVMLLTWSWHRARKPHFRESGANFTSVVKL